MSDTPKFSVWFAEAFEALEANPNEVALKIGIGNKTIYNIINGAFKPSFETINKILDAYPRLNANWLMKGQKPILHESGAVIIGTDSVKYVTLPLLAVSADLPNLPTNMHADTYPVLIDDPHKELNDCVVVKITDSSMLPRYPIGMKLLAKPIESSDWDYLNSALVLVYYRSTLVVRRIKENELIAKNYLTLYPDNQDSGFVMVKRDDLRSIWRVVEVVGGGVE